MRPPVGEIKVEYIGVPYLSTAYSSYYVDIHAVGYGFDIKYSLEIKKRGGQFKFDGGNACNRKLISEFPIGNSQLSGQSANGLWKLRKAAKDVTEQLITSLQKAVNENDAEGISRHFSEQFRLESCTGRTFGKSE